MLQAQEIMDGSAALLNDTLLTKFTYLKQIPYLNIAIDELQETMEQNNISLTNEQVDEITILAGDTSIAQADMPLDLVEIRTLYERTNSSEDYQLMSHVDFLPPFVTPLQFLVYWALEGDTVKFIGATDDVQVRMQYIKKAIPKVVSPTTAISVINCKTFLEYRNAALCAQFIGENKERSDDLNVNAQLALDRFVSINNKGRQSIATRRRPFMAGWKVRTGF